MQQCYNALVKEQQTDKLWRQVYMYYIGDEQEHTYAVRKANEAIVEFKNHNEIRYGRI